MTFIYASYWSWIADTYRATMSLTCAWRADINSAWIDMMRKAEAKSQCSVTLLRYHANEKCTRAAFLEPKFKVSQVLKTFFLKVTHAGVTESRSHLLVHLPRCPQGRVNHLRVIAMRMGQSRTWLAQAVASHQTVVQSQRDVTQSTRVLCAAGRMGIGSSVSQVLHLRSSSLQFRGPALI